jgi:hypothetical protein
LIESAQDRWYQFGSRYWEPYFDEFVGKLYDTSADSQHFDWVERIWSRLKVVDPA